LLLKEPFISGVNCIDADDHIDSVNEAWAALAIAAQLPGGVIGASLWDHIVGVDVAHV
jgi:hypothetical protein